MITPAPSMVLSLGMEGGLSAHKSWGNFHMITDILQPPLIGGARAATRVFTEVPLPGPASHGETQGRTDLVFEYGGPWRVVEFKTECVIGAEAVRNHAKQLEGYAAGRTAMVAAPVRPVMCFVREAWVVNP
jgi:hypothetical protein